MEKVIDAPKVDLEVSVMMAKLLAKKGQYCKMVIKRPCKMRKGQAQLYKRSEFVCRVGVSYDNIAEVKERRVNGIAPEVNAGLPWGEWVIPNYIIKHNNELYVRYTTTNKDKAATAVYLDENDNEVSRDVAKTMCLGSEFPAPKIATIVTETAEGGTTTTDVEVKTLVNNVKIANIVSVV